VAIAVPVVWLKMREVRAREREADGAERAVDEVDGR
jgi:hypothetical protein